VLPLEPLDVVVLPDAAEVDPLPFALVDVEPFAEPELEVVPDVEPESEAAAVVEPLDEALVVVDVEPELLPADVELAFEDALVPVDAPELPLLAPVVLEALELELDDALALEPSVLPELPWVPVVLVPVAVGPEVLPLLPGVELPEQPTCAPRMNRKPIETSANRMWRICPRPLWLSKLHSIEVSSVEARRFWGGPHFTFI